MKTVQYDAIIVGAGMVGAALACALGQQGMQVLLLDHAGAPTAYDQTQLPDLRVSALNSVSKNIFQHLNVWQQLETTRFCAFSKMLIWEELDKSFSLGNLLFSKRASTGKRLNQTTLDCRNINEPALGYIVENRLLQLSLYQTIELSDNITLINDINITEYIDNETDSLRQIKTDGQCIYTSPLIVGADGSHSKIRQWSNIKSNRKEYKQHALVATVEINEGPLDTTWQAFAATGPMALLPLPDCNNRHYASLVWYHQPSDVKRLIALSDSAFLRELSYYFPEELPKIISLHQRKSFPLIKQFAQRYIAEGVVLVGDSAHTVNPLAGQGVNLGLMDMAVLTEVILEARQRNLPYHSMETLKKYEDRRKQDNRNMGWVLDAFYYGFSNDSLPLKLARNIGLSLGDKAGLLSTTIEKYGAGYRGHLPPLAQKPAN